MIGPPAGNAEIDHGGVLALHVAAHSAGPRSVLTILYP
jgi:hypothetical protein